MKRAIYNGIFAVLYTFFAISLFTGHIQANPLAEGVLALIVASCCILDAIGDK